VPARRLAIYSPASAAFFEAGGRGSLGGGAELQMALLATELAARGLRTALIVWPLDEDRAGASRPGMPDALTLIERPAHDGGGRGGGLREARHIWRAMAAADAEAYIFRGSSTRLVVGAAFCRLRRRKLVFSAANDLDFDFGREDRSGLGLRLYRASLGQADLVVVQSDQQLELARAAVGGSPELIPSFAEPVAPAEISGEGPDAFIWIGRLVDYKNPLAFVRLAEALPEARFRMVAFPTDETRPELTAAVTDAGERLPNLELTGKLPRPEVLALTARAVAIVSTSDAEGMPNVFLEAWSRAVPVISLDYDPDGRIEAGGLGLVAGGSERRLAELAGALWADRARRDELGERGREHVLGLHSPEAVGAEWARAIEALLER
jgi:glycosyltransferase involved in cell wall biosynthesis